MKVTETRAIAEFVGAVEFEDLNPALVLHAKMSVLDLVGCMVVGARSEHSKQYMSYFDRQPKSDESTIALSGIRHSAYFAAMANGTFAHATELSETFTRAVVHPGNVIIPAVLAVAERDGIPGQRVLAAVAAGYETLIRIGLSVGRPFMLQQGFHIPATTGAFGAAVAVANLLDFDADEVEHVLGITACLVPTSLMVAARDGATIKDVFEGHAAATGVMATDLRRTGLSGITDGLTTWGSAMSSTFEPKHLTEDLGDVWKVLSGGLHFKERALLAMGQPAFDATRSIWEDHEVPPDRVTRILVETSGRSSLGGMVHPNNTVSAKASIPFVVAVSLAHPDLIRDDPHFVRTLTPEILDDPLVSRLADLVEVRIDPVIDKEFEVEWPMKFAARVTVELDGGASLEAYSDIWPRSSTLGYADVTAKFADVARGMLSSSQIESIPSLVDSLDVADDVSDLMGHVRTGEVSVYE